MSDTSSDIEDGSPAWDSDNDEQAGVDVQVEESGGFSLDNLIDVTEEQLQNLEKLHQEAQPPPAPDPCARKGSWQAAAAASNSRRRSNSGAGERRPSGASMGEKSAPVRKSSWRDAAAASRRRKSDDTSGESQRSSTAGLGISEDQLKLLQQQHELSKVSSSASTSTRSKANTAIVKAAARVAAGASSSKLGGMSELAMALQRRKKIAAGELPQSLNKPFNPYVLTDQGLSRPQIKHMMQLFKKSARTKEERERGVEAGMGSAGVAGTASSAATLGLGELKLFMERLGHAQTHLSLKGMIKEVDADGDSALSIREFFAIFQKAHEGTLQSQGLKEMYHTLTSVDVGEQFFEAKANEQTRHLKNENEIKREQEKLRETREAARKRKESFLRKRGLFK